MEWQGTDFVLKFCDFQCFLDAKKERKQACL